MTFRAPTADRDTVAKLYRGLADPVRLALLTALRAGPSTAGRLAADVGVSPSRASNHLRCLLECGLVKVELSGRHTVYRLADPAVERLLASGDEALELVAPLIEACRNYGLQRRHPVRQPSGHGPASGVDGRHRRSASSIQAGSGTPRRPAAVR
jgi:DNA-binding transcriptional ArsR family regulator